jgi:hypothetical protein
MVVSVSPLVQSWNFRERDIGTIDFITSRASTLPYDDATMRRMIRLVQAAKGTPVCSEGKGDR